MPSSPPALGRRHREGDRDAELGEPLGQGQVAPPPVLPEPDQLGPEGAPVVVHEVDEDVHASRGDRHAGDLAPRDEGDPELPRPVPRPGPTPASESWSVRATALHPAAAASSTIRSGGSLPSETVEWVCRSITAADATGPRPAATKVAERAVRGQGGTVCR